MFDDGISIFPRSCNLERQAMFMMPLLHTFAVERKKKRFESETEPQYIETKSIIQKTSDSSFSRHHFSRRHEMNERSQADMTLLDQIFSKERTLSTSLAEKAGMATSLEALQICLARWDSKLRLVI